MAKRLVEVQLAKGRTVAGDKLVHGVFSDTEPEFARLGAEGARTAKSLATALRFRGEAERTAEIPLGGKGRTLTLVGLGKSAEFTVEKASATSPTGRISTSPARPTSAEMARSAARPATPSP